MARKGEMARAASGKPSAKKATKASKASDKKAAEDKEVKKDVTVIRIEANSGIFFFFLKQWARLVMV